MSSLDLHRRQAAIRSQLSGEWRSVGLLISQRIELHRPSTIWANNQRQPLQRLHSWQLGKEYA